MSIQKASIMVVDDNRSILSALEILLVPEFGEVTLISNPNQIVTELRKKDYNLVILDMNFTAGIKSGNEGIYWLGRIRETFPEISVVLITAYGDIQMAVKAIKAGATDFVLKPWENEKLLATLYSAMRLRESRDVIENLKIKNYEINQALNDRYSEIIGQSGTMQKIFQTIDRVAKTDANVLILGENGTGKELIARAIHRNSARKNENFASVDLGSITETLFESELFGHKKGSFTDARENRQGKFEIAHKGTLFLDEIGNLSLPLQAKLLAAIENRQITRIGSNEPVQVDIRLICATNRDIDNMVTEGLFREDLLYRINTIQIELPALRERGKDIVALAEFFLQKYTCKYNKRNLKINRQAIDKLMDYSWPGNIRELQNTIEKAVILCDTAVIKPEDLYLKPVSRSIGFDSIATLEEVEQRMMTMAIEKNNGNLTAAAEQLGITRQTLYNRMKKDKK